MNWGILGQGVIAHQMAQALLQEHGTIYAVAGRHPKKVEAFAKQYTIAHAYTIDEVMQDEHVDIVYIATPHSNHFEYIMQALQHHKHVLCEKAITVNAQQLEEAMAFAKKHQLILMEAMTIFHMPIMKKAKERIESGKLGKLKMLQINFGSCKEYDITNRFFAKELAGGALLDIGTYAISLARYFLHAQPHIIKTDMLLFETGVDEMSGIILRNKEDEMANITLTMRAKLPKRAVIAGELGYLELCEYPRGDKATWKMTQDGHEEMMKDGESALALCYEIRDMEEAVRTGQNETLQLSYDVTKLLWEVRKQWGMIYPFE